jgi:mRNA-degrading endonuclease YafQ of YafQ-DinJ toxin-antitoxin module
MGENRIENIEYSKKFLKSLKGLPIKIVNQAQEKEKIFKENPFNPILKTHKLTGKEKEAWAFWINYAYCIKFLFLSNNEVLFLNIGTHDIYK